MELRNKEVDAKLTDIYGMLEKMSDKLEEIMGKDISGE